jgi:hypothetical protein
MFYSSINTDFAAYQTKVAFGLTKRQIICFLLAAMFGLPTYFFTKEYLGTDVSGILMIIVMVPFFAFAMYKKNGQTLETVLKHYIKEQYFSNKVRHEIMGDGYKKAAPTDSVKSSNSSGIDDVTARTAINRTLITSGNIEDIFPYGKDEYIDTLIDLERAMKLYIAIIDSYDENMSDVLSMRLEGIKHEQIAKEFLLGEGTVTQYIYRSKASLKERFEEVNALFEARKRLRRIAKEENGVGNLKKASND